MMNSQGGNRRRLQELIERFRQKGATSPETAMTLQELGLPPRFQEAMHRRLGATGIFVEVEGKFYLNEVRLKELQEQRARSGTGNGSARMGRSGPPTWARALGILLILPIGFVIALIVSYFAFSGGGYFPGEFLAIAVVVFAGLTIVRLFYWRWRRRRWNQNPLV
jgi:hypothetical protein